MAFQRPRPTPLRNGFPKEGVETSPISFTCSAGTARVLGSSQRAAFTKCVRQGVFGSWRHTLARLCGSRHAETCAVVVPVNPADGGQFGVVGDPPRSSSSYRLSRGPPRRLERVESQVGARGRGHPTADAE